MHIQTSKQCVPLLVLRVNNSKSIEQYSPTEHAQHCCSNTCELLHVHSVKRTAVGLAVGASVSTGAAVAGGFVTGGFVTGGFVTGAFVTGAFVTGAAVVGAAVVGAAVVGAAVVGVAVVGAAVSGASVSATVGAAV
jgi:hypothetical protein